jgi:hypothetical protein
LNPDNPLLKLIIQKCQGNTDQDHIPNLVSEICVEYLKKHPELAIYAPKLMLRILILIKYAWYALMSKPQESSYERFLKWHARTIHSQSPQISADQLTLLLEEQCKKSIPLIPFDAALCRQCIARFYQ